MVYASPCLMAGRIAFACTRLKGQPTTTAGSESQLRLPVGRPLCRPRMGRTQKLIGGDP